MRNSLTFDGEAEKDGYFLAKGGAGADTFLMGKYFNATDQVNGRKRQRRAGSERKLRRVGFERFDDDEHRRAAESAAGSAYNITTNDANVASGQSPKSMPGIWPLATA